MSAVPVTMSRNAKSPSLSYRDARESPCLSCSASPCCTHLLLSDFQVKSLMDIDYAMFLLNFEGIVLGVGQDWKMDVYLYQPCGYLDLGSGLCTVHSTPLQPAVCVHYNGHSCGYRLRMSVDHPEVDDVRPLVDRNRMAWLADQMTFDDERRVIATPEWSEVLEGLRARPMDRRPLTPAGPDPVYEEWKSIALSPKAPDDGPDVKRWSDHEVSSPCEGCGAWCCKMLVFNRGVPCDASQLEFMRYCLGFPSVEVGLSDDGWAVIVHTTCRHLDGNRCSVFGTDERPLKCGYYDALSCRYRGHFGVPEPADVVRVKRDHFPAVTSALVFDDQGRVLAIPPLELLRQRVEAAMRAEAGLPGSPSAFQTTNTSG